MVAETQVNPTNGAPSPPAAVARSAGELLADALTLLELQARLLKIDAEDDLKKLILPAVLFVAGAVLGLSCLPIAMVALALGLVAAAGFEPWLAFLIALCGGGVISAALVAMGIALLRSRLTFLPRSRAEWQQNVNWFKSVARRLSARSDRSVPFW
jgi:membrane protein DedA with SNARE-associated domain